MKKNKSLFLLIIFSALLFGQKDKDFLEIKSRYGFKVQRLAPASFNLYVDYEGLSRQPKIYLAFTIQNDLLQFRQTDKNYEAAYQVNVAIRKQEQTLYSESWIEEVKLKSFKETNSRRKLQNKTYQLENFKSPAASDTENYDYQCFLEILDLGSHKTHYLKQDFKIKPLLKDSVQFCYIGFFEGTADSIQNRSLLPRKKSLAFNSPYFAMSCLNTADRQAQVKVFLQRKENEKFKEYEQRTLKVEPDSGIFKVIYPLPNKTLKEGKYRLIFKYKETEIKKEFNIIWFEKPIYLYKIDLAMRPLKYVIGEALYDSVTSLKQNELEKWFYQYWKQYDDTPDTEFNELLFEYYKRVDFCNRHFSRRSVEGWETDRGQIYLLYGEPQKIENRSHSANTLPYLIWTYDDSLQFVFVDKKDNGEFILIEDEIKE